jgi:PD-(D/E)XK nuclease superfamily protein
MNITIDAPGDIAAELASRIAVPRQLPPNYRGEPLRHLSHSSVTAFRLCPESFRRSYICGEWGPPSGEQFVGNRVDDAISRFYDHMLHGEKLNPKQLKTVFADIWKAEVARENERNGGVRWPADLPAGNARELGLQAIELTLEELVPRLGRPLAVQRKFEFKLDEALEWKIVGTVDLDTIREQTVFVTETGEPHSAIQDEGESEPTVEFPYLEAPAEFREPVKRGRELLAPADAIDAYHREWEAYQARVAEWRAEGDPDRSEPKEPKPLPAVHVPVRVVTAHAVTREVVGITDYKVKSTLLGESSAARDMQAGAYLCERWLAGRPAHDFRFAQVGKPKQGRRVNMSTALVPTRYSEQGMRAVLARIAQTASNIRSTYDRLGPDRPWGWATQDWKCDYCTHGPNGTNSCPFAITGG